MDVTFRDTDGRRIVRVAARRIDAAAATAFREAARHAMLGGPPVAILDLGEVEFVDSSGLGAIVGLKKLLHPQIEVQVADLRPRVASVFALTRMDLVFTIHGAVPDGAGPGGAVPDGAGTGGAVTDGAGTGGAVPDGAGPGGAVTDGAGPGGAADAA